MFCRVDCRPWADTVVANSDSSTCSASIYPSRRPEKTITQEAGLALLDELTSIFYYEFVGVWKTCESRPKISVVSRIFSGKLLLTFWVVKSSVTFVGWLRDFNWTAAVGSCGFAPVPTNFIRRQCRNETTLTFRPTSNSTAKRKIQEKFTAPIVSRNVHSTKTIPFFFYFPHTHTHTQFSHFLREMFRHHRDHLARKNTATACISPGPVVYMYIRTDNVKLYSIGCIIGECAIRLQRLVRHSQTTRRKAPERKKGARPIPTFSPRHWQPGYLCIYTYKHTFKGLMCISFKKNKQNNCVCDVYIRGWRQHRVCNVFVSSSLFVCIVIKDGTEVVSWNYIDGHLTDATGSIYRVHSVNASREKVRSDGEHSFCAELGGVLSWLIWPTPRRFRFSPACLCTVHRSALKVERVVCHHITREGLLQRHNRQKPKNKNPKKKLKEEKYKSMASRLSVPPLWL